MYSIQSIHGIDLVYRHSKSNVAQLVILKLCGLHSLLLKELFNSTLAGYIGICKTMLAFQAQVYQLRMIDDKKQYMHGCYVYQLAKDINALPAMQLYPLPVCERWFDFQTLDFITGLAANGLFNAVIVCIDKLTKLVRLVLCLVGYGKLTAPSIGRFFFTHVVCFYGIPHFIYINMILGLQVPTFKHCLTYQKVRYSFPVHSIHKLMAKQREAITPLSKSCIVYLLNIIHSGWNVCYQISLPLVEFAINTSV